MNSGDFSTLYLRLLIDFLTTPLGAVAMLLLLGMTLLSVVWQPMRWGLIFGAVYAATLPINRLAYDVVYVPLAFPIEQLRLYARPLTLTCMSLLLLPLLTSNRGWRRRVVSWPLILFFVFELGIALRLTVLGTELRGPLSIASYGLLFVAFGVATGLWLKDFADVNRLLWCAGGAGIVVALTTVYQLGINRSPIIIGNRLAGMTGNPQFLGAIIALTLPTLAYLISRPVGRKWVRPALAVTMAVMVILLLWTGSRTGALGTTVGLVVLFHRRPVPLLIVGSVVAVAVYFLLPYFEGSTAIAARLLSGQNTRAWVWEKNIREIAGNFWLGASREALAVNESSYLAMMSQLGLIGTLPFLAAFGGFVYQIVRLVRVRKLLGDEASLVDLLISFWASVAAICMFDGYLLGVLVYPVMMIYLFSAATTFVLDWAQAVEAEKALPLDPFAYPAAAA